MYPNTQHYKVHIGRIVIAHQKLRDSRTFAKKVPIQCHGIDPGHDGKQRFASIAELLYIDKILVSTQLFRRSADKGNKQRGNVLGQLICY